MNIVIGDIEVSGNAKSLAVFVRCFPLFFAVIARCFSLLFFCRDGQKPRHSDAFAGGAAVLLWKNSEKQRRLAAAPVLP
jgi:hypothetical protein